VIGVLLDALFCGCLLVHLCVCWVVLEVELSLRNSGIHLSITSIHPQQTRRNKVEEKEKEEREREEGRKREEGKGKLLVQILDQSSKGSPLSQRHFKTNKQ